MSLLKFELQQREPLLERNKGYNLITKDIIGSIKMKRSRLLWRGCNGHVGKLIQWKKGNSYKIASSVLFIFITVVLLNSCNTSKGVYITKTLKTKEDYKLYDYTSLIKMNFYHEDTIHFMQYGFGIVVINKVPIVTDSVGRQFEKDLYPGKLKIGIINPGNQYKKFKLKVNLKYQYKVKVVLKSLNAPKDGIIY